MTIELERALRRVKPEQRRKQFAPRPPIELTAAKDLAIGGRPFLLLDTNVYINSAAGRLSREVTDLLDRSLLFHCSVCVSELTTGIGNRDPSHADWSATRDHYSALITRIPDTRLLTPDPAIWAEAGLIAGTLARTQHFQRNQRKECLNDALIFLTAAKSGLPVLTENRDEFDLIQQLAPAGVFIHY